jgi:outer membrane protein assembly factor BamB
MLKLLVNSVCLLMILTGGILFADPPKVDPESSPVSLWTRKSGDDWPNFLGKRYDGKSSETGIRTEWKNGKLPLLWTKKLDTSYGIGSVAYGRIYLFGRRGNEEVLTCLNAETGKELWQFGQPVSYVDMFGYNNGPRSSPTIDGGRVFTLGVAGRLTCRDSVQGNLLWTRDLHEEYQVVQNFFGVATNPLVIGDRLLVMVGGSPKEDLQIPTSQLDRVTSNGSALVALDKRSGREIWRSGNDLASYSTPRPLQSASVQSSNKEREPQTMVTLARGGVLLTDVASGKTLWQFPWRAEMLESVNAAVPVVRGNEVFISECYQIGSVLLRTDLPEPQVLWSDTANRREKSMRAHWPTPIEVDGYLYGCSGRNEPDSDLRCIQWSDGKVQWSDPRRIRSSLLYVDGHLIVLDENGRLQLIKANPQQLNVVTEIELGKRGEDGRPLLRRPCWAAPILSHGLLYVRGEDQLACFELIPN